MNAELNQLPTGWGIRDRLGLLLGLGCVIALAWAYLLYMGWGMEHMDVGVNVALMPRMTHWELFDLLLVFLMWAIMMLAMMLPSAAPMILVFAALDRQRREGASHVQRVCAFVAGYVTVWTGFSIFATLVQWGLLEARLVSSMMRSTSPALGATVLIAAGAFQFTRFKQSCLVTCRSPLAFLAAHWRPAIGGAFAMGLKHGAYCLGCCWLLMALLFVLGVMNVVWIAALAAFVLLEKTFPRIVWVGRISGAVLIAWGAGLLLSN
jgi:predicted metal-binding membrane protein